MINIDFECGYGHRFEGSFSNYESFVSQHDSKMIRCPLCDTGTVKRVYTGCSIHARAQADGNTRDASLPLYELVREINAYVKNNFEDAGDNFADSVRQVHYGLSEKRNIYGRSTLEEMKELHDEGIGVLPLPDIEKSFS